MDDRLAFLLRRNRGRMRRQDVLDDLSAAFGRAIDAGDVQPLEEGDRLRAAALPLVESTRAARRGPGFSTWAESSTGALGEGLSAFGAALAGTRTIYLPFAWSFLGPIALRPVQDFGRAVAVARRCVDECPLCSVDAVNGLWLQYHADDAEHGEEHPYELVVWGAEWQALARRTLPFEVSRPEA